jgi:hypothetical protein
MSTTTELVVLNPIPQHDPHPDSHLHSMAAHAFPRPFWLFVFDKCLGLVESLGEFYPEALWQRCAVHFYRNVWTAVPTSKSEKLCTLPHPAARTSRQH